MDEQAAARFGDEIAHGFGLAAMVAGAVAGALIGAAVIGLTAATGGMAAVIFAGAVATGGLSTLSVVKGLSTIFDLPEPASGVLVVGSVNVYINSRNAMRAGVDVAAVCSGFPCNHYPWPVALIAEGSATVFVNGRPMVRLTSKLVCGAHVKSASPNTYVGGPTARVAFVWDFEHWAQSGLELLGLGALLGAAAFAAMAGAAALGIFAVVTGASMAAMQGLSYLGNLLGPGYADLFQGIAGWAMIGAGTKLAGESGEVDAGIAEDLPAAQRGAIDAPPTVTTETTQEWIYGPEDDPKINPDGSTNPDTWTSPDHYETQDEIKDRLDPFKPPEGRRPATIPSGSTVQRGTTPGGEGPYRGRGGANETLHRTGLPPGSVGDWEPL